MLRPRRLRGVGGHEFQGGRMDRRLQGGGRAPRARARGERRADRGRARVHGSEPRGRPRAGRHGEDVEGGGLPRRRAQPPRARRARRQRAGLRHVPVVRPARVAARLPPHGARVRRRVHVHGRGALPRRRVRVPPHARGGRARAVAQVRRCGFPPQRLALLGGGGRGAAREGGQPRADVHLPRRVGVRPRRVDHRAAGCRTTPRSTARARRVPRPAG